MVTKSTFINKTKMKKVNVALRKAGYSGYVGDRTSTHPDGSGSGYVMNLLNNLEPTNQDAQSKIISIINSVI